MRRFAVLIPLLAFFLMSPILAFAQSSGDVQSKSTERGYHHGGTDDGTKGMHHGKSGMSDEMRAKHEQFEKDMQAMDARLEEKVAAMNSATGDKKVDAMAGVINELVAQRKEMKEKFSGMHGMMNCPMMGERHGMKDGGGCCSGGDQGKTPNGKTGPAGRKS